MKKWAFQAFWTLVEHSSIRVLDALLTIILIQVFSAEQFGLFSVYQSWTSLILLFLPSLELVLYREFGSIRAQGRLKEELAVYRSFNYIKLLLALLFAFALSFLPKPMVWSERLALVLLAFALPLSQAFYGFLREILRFEMKMRVVALVSVIQRIALIAGIVSVAVLRPHDSLAISITAIIIYVLFGVVWGMPVRKLFGRHKDFSECFQRSKAILSSIVLWIHLNGVLTQFIQTLDTFFLGNLGVSLTTVGFYSVALKSANFFQVLPVALVNPFGVYLGQNSSNPNEEKEKQRLKKMMLLFFLLSILLFTLGYFFAEKILILIGRGKITDVTLPMAREFFVWQLGGILIFCATHPLSAYLGARSSLRGMTLHVFLPWLVASLALYGFSASRGGALWAAYANVPVYVCFFALLLRYYFVTKKLGRNSK